MGCFSSSSRAPALIAALTTLVAFAAACASTPPRPTLAPPEYEEPAGPAPPDAGDELSRAAAESQEAAKST